MRRVIFGLCVCFCFWSQIGFSFTKIDKSSRSSSSLDYREKASLFSRNDIVQVEVNGDDFGRYGQFMINHADGRTLTYDSWTSHFNLNVDGSIGSSDISSSYITGSLDLLSMPEIQSDSTIITRWAMDNVLVEQHLKPVQFSPATGAILIKYIVTNVDTESHEVGVLLEIDTMVNDNDRAPLSTSFGYSDFEQGWSGSNVPTFWQAYEFDPPNVGLVAQGTLAGGEATPPDVFIVGDWGTGLNSIAWNYAPSGANYGDSAVILRWGLDYLAPEEQRTYATYYGIGELEFQEGDLALMVSGNNQVTCSQDELSPNPFDLNLLVTNTGAAVSGLQATLTLPSELAYAPGESPVKPVNPTALANGESGTTSWSIRIPPGLSGVTLSANFAVTSNTVANNYDVMIFIPPCNENPGFDLQATPNERILLPGGEASYTISIVPDEGFSDSVALTLSGPSPYTDQLTGIFNPSTLSYPNSSTLTIVALPTATEGSHLFTISGITPELVSAEVDVLLHISAEPSIWPSPFTPNHDGINDGVHFVLQGMAVTSPELKIYNFRGKEVLATSEYNGTEFYWDGHGDDGEIQQPGVYLYLIQDSSGEIASGSVVLAR